MLAYEPTVYTGGPSGIWVRWVPWVTGTYHGKQPPPDLTWREVCAHSCLIILAPSSAHQGHPTLSISTTVTASTATSHPGPSTDHPPTSTPTWEPGAGVLRNWPGSGHGPVFPPQPVPLPVSSAQDRRLSEGPPHPCWFLTGQLPAVSARKRPWTQEAGSRGWPCLLLFPTASVGSEEPAGCSSGGYTDA